ncbi:hypothetical protein Pmani_025526 [Petrolisthes manimaculis]|uniref:Chitin-binding type-2 domain-containing protein n=1 Tax=Petrolisthes manimaculis TaxID=1843537 RepID=A0AAE1U129_9EUCA|nr:hypothetical protein Pmani_025526 [Petrolisthes manimaculis]
MISRERDCVGYPYSPDKKRCVGHHEMPNCQPKAFDNTKSPHVPGLDFHCVDPDVKGACEHCYVGINCIEGKAYVNLCTNFDDSCTDDVFVGYCIPKAQAQAIEACKPLGINIYIDYFNVTYYHICDQNAQFRETYTCPAGKYFNEDTNKCEEETPPPDCTSESNGPVINPDNCQHYYNCLPDGTLLTGNCDTGDYFYQEDTQTCKLSCEIKAKLEGGTTFDACTDPNVGNYDSNPEECTIYYLCIGGDAIERTCPDGTYFDPLVNNCVSGPLPDECQPQYDYTQCPGYNSVVPC